MKLSETRMSAWLKGRGACGDGVAWAGDKTLREAWRTCPRPDWLLWALNAADLLDPMKNRRFACRCVRAVWNLLTDPRSRSAVETAERFCDGKATQEELGAVEADAWNSIWRSDAWAASAAALETTRGAGSFARGAARYSVWDAARNAQADILVSLNRIGHSPAYHAWNRNHHL